ncbi:MAG: DNA mismatch repair protein MutS [Rhodobacterales bacterium]|nr:MAG: DNA mismatch repair protein MutS [Rhodobacterales bacterium]
MVAKRTDPLKKPAKPKLSSDAVPKKTAPGPIPQPQPKPVQPFRVGGKVDHHGTHDLLPSLSEQIGGESLRMDRKTHSRMTRGKLAPEARIDLHGMTLAEAHPELIRFVLTSHTRGMRLILVITGKGKHRDDGGPIPTRLGVLRHQVPVWLRQAPLGPLVLQVTEAAQKHGGHGAYYVYLKRRR